MANDDPSTRFPFINLEKAIERAQSMFDGDRSAKPMAITTAFQLWGYSPKSSGGFQTISALKLYGLIEDEGAKADRKVKLSAAAKRYFLDERDAERSKMLSEFALHPPLIRTLWERDGWSEGIPADTVARSHLKIERHLNDQSARALLGIFKDNLAHAGLRASAAAQDTLESGELDREDDGQQKPRGKPMGEVHREREPHRQPPPPPSGGKAIMFDMETVTVSATFDNADDLDAFIEKLQRLKPLMPAKQ